MRVVEERSSGQWQIEVCPGMTGSLVLDVDESISHSAACGARAIGNGGRVETAAQTDDIDVQVQGENRGQVDGTGLDWVLEGTHG